MRITGAAVAVVLSFSAVASEEAVSGVAAVLAAAASAEVWAVAAEPVHGSDRYGRMSFCNKRIEIISLIIKKEV